MSEDSWIVGRMQAWPLTLDRIVTQAARWHGARDVVSRDPDGRVRRRTYTDLEAKARSLSAALIRAGVGRGDRVATLAMNGFDHLALWYGVMGVGAICHTLNPRLHDDQIAYIINHAGDRMLFADPAYLPIVDRLRPRCPSLGAVIVLGEGQGSAQGLADFVAGADGASVVWGGFAEETAAGLCYTSGTTGDPKGVLYSHRSNTLLAMNTIMPDAFALSSREVIMPVVPMFHANTWGLAFSAPMVGAKLVLPGGALDGRSLHELIESEGVTFSAGVPTVWQGYLDHLRAEGVRRSSLRRVVIGGAACPESVMGEMEALGIEVLHAWGMTELSPVGLAATPTPETLALSPDEQRAFKLKQGHPVGIDAQIVDDAGEILPNDGETVGRLMVKGPAVIARYAGHDASALTPDGWFDTGDVAAIDPLGFVRITDRAKDIIKSGGEWISSVDIENALLTHPNVALAAVIAMRDDKWGERPKLFVQLRTPSDDPPETYRRFLEGRVAKWWLPDIVEIIDAIPIGSTGKIDKKALRAMDG